MYMSEFLQTDQETIEIVQEEVNTIISSNLEDEKLRQAGAFMSTDENL